jgi:nitroreductase
MLRAVEWQVDHFEQIPVIVVCCLRGGYRMPFLPSPAWFATTHYGSVYPAVQNLLLASRAAGLGASLITLPLWSTMVVHRLLRLPLRAEPCCMVPLGWPLGRYGLKYRRPATSVLHRDRLGQPWISK